MVEEEGEPFTQDHEKEDHPRAYVQLLQTFRRSQSNVTTELGRGELTSQLERDEQISVTKDYVLRRVIPVVSVILVVSFVIGFVLLPEYWLEMTIVLPIISLISARGILSYKKKIISGLGRPKLTAILFIVAFCSVIVNILLETPLAYYLLFAMVGFAVVIRVQVKKPKPSPIKVVKSESTVKRTLPSLKVTTSIRDYVPVARNFLLVISGIASAWFFYWGFYWEMIVWHKNVADAFASSSTNWLLFIVFLFVTCALITKRKGVNQ